MKERERESVCVCVCGSEAWLHPFVTSASDGGEWVDPRTCLDDLENVKYFFPLSGIEPRFLRCPVHSLVMEINNETVIGYTLVWIRFEPGTSK